MTQVGVISCLGGGRPPLSAFLISIVTGIYLWRVTTLNITMCADIGSLFLACILVNFDGA